MRYVNNIFDVIIGSAHGLFYILMDTNYCLVNVSNNRKTLTHHKHNNYRDENFGFTMIVPWKMNLLFGLLKIEKYQWFFRSWLIIHICYLPSCFLNVSLRNRLKSFIFLRNKTSWVFNRSSTSLEFLPLSGLVVVPFEPLIFNAKMYQH